MRRLQGRDRGRAEGLLTEREFHDMENRAAEEIEAAIRYSEKECTDPDPADILRGVYSTR